MDTRISNPINFRQNIHTTEYTAAEVQSAKQQKTGSLLPSGTSVSELIKQVFDTHNTVDGQLLNMLEQACPDPSLRTPAAFQDALRKLREKLRERHKKQNRGRQNSEENADDILDELIDNKNLLDFYRATILE